MSRPGETLSIDTGLHAKMEKSNTGKDSQQSTAAMKTLRCAAIKGVR